MVTPLRRGLRRGSAAAADPQTPAPPSPAAGQEEIRRQNLGAVLRYVHVHGPTSRAELTSSLGLNRSTIGALAADLAASGLVTEEAPPPARRAGRPSPLVSPRSAAVYADALSIEADRLRAARVGLGGRILDLREAPRPPGDVVPTLAALVRSLEPEGFCAGGAVAVADTTRAADGTLDVGGADEGLAAALDAALDAPGRFLVGDLADIAALAEHTRGAAAGIDDLIYLHGDLGVSAGIVTGGRLVIGHRGHSGKVGHMVVNPTGRRCGCGSKGCWETEIGTEALLRHAGLPPGSDHLPVVRAAEHGDAAALAALDRVGDWLGFGVANLVNVFNPDIVIFGGTLGDLYPAIAPAIRRRLDMMALPASREHLQLRPTALGDEAALIGAAELAFNPLLTDPLTAAGLLSNTPADPSADPADPSADPADPSAEPVVPGR